MAYDVFLSHASDDKPTADAVCARLEQAGVRCWIAPRDVTGGESWAASILRALGECRVLVVVLSSRANRSTQVMQEVERAVHKGLVVLPFRIEDVLPAGDLELFLSRRHWLDALTPPLDAHIATLVTTVRQLLALSPAPEPPAPGPPPRRPEVSPVDFDRGTGLWGRIRRLLDPPDDA